MEQTAKAIALATVLVATSLSVAPAAASHQDCHGTFDIADSEVLADDQPLDTDQVEIGRESVVTGVEETLHVELLTMNDELTWTVFIKDGNSCTEYDQGDCDQNNELDSPQEVTCTLQAPEDRDYRVEFENTEVNGDQLEFEVWVS